MTASAPTAGSKLPLTVALAFAATSLPISGLGIAVAVHLPAYFAGAIGVELTVVAAAFALVRFIDVPIEPALGIMMDRTRTRFGRYRLWTLAGAPFLMLGLYMLMNAGPGVGQGFLVAWLLVMYLGLSILVLSHQAWASTLARTYDERARIFGIMGAVGVAGAVSVLLIPILMEQSGYPEVEGVRAMVWYILALAPVAVGLVVWRTPETLARHTESRPFRLRDYWELIVDPSMGRILLADLALSLGPGWMAALYIFFMRDALGFTAGQANILLAIYIVAGVAGAPILAGLAARISKHRAVMLCSAGYSLLLLTFLVLPHGNLWLAAPTMFATGFLAAGFNVLTRAMTADVADEVRLRHGKERSGLLYAMTTLTTKIAAGASIFLTFNALAQAGYDPKLGDANSPEAIQALVLCFLSGPIVFVMLGAAFMIGYRLDAERAADVRRQLDDRDSAMDPAASLEGLTGNETPPPASTR